MANFSPGQLFAGRYRIERPLASGGMGAVYVATHLATEAEVALKVLLPHRVESARARERFGEEARNAARVRSEHIVQVLDAGMDDATDLPFFAMELLRGRSLADEVQARGRCTVGETAVYMRHVAYGLDRAHAHRDARDTPCPIVHRDLKPENLFLTQRDDGSPLVKILDFGIAKLVSESAELSGDIKGTPEYMALEQLRGESTCPQTDIWPLGLIAFFLLSGCAFWRSSHDPSSDIQSLFQELLAPRKARPSERAVELGVGHGWGAAFDDWFARCLSASPRDRFPSAGAAVDALEAALAHVLPDPETDPALRSYVRPSATERNRVRGAATTEPWLDGQEPGADARATRKRR